MKILLLLLDGLGDRAFERLGHRTPLQAAACPHLDRLAALGSNGLYHAGEPGQCLPSEMAHYLLFGYPEETFPGRGLLEAVGFGVSFEDDDVLCLAHLAGVTWENEIAILAQKRPKVEASGLDALFATLEPLEIQGLQFRLHRTRGNDAILIMRGGASPFVSDSDTMMPGTSLARVAPVAGNPEPAKADRTAMALNRYLRRCHETLKDHPVNTERAAQGLQPANFLVTQRCGRRRLQEPFSRRWGMKGMLVASGAMYGGLARELGLTFVQVKDTADPGQDLRERIRLAMENQDHDFVHIHTKVPDDTAHNGGPEIKRDAIASLDEGLDEITRMVASQKEFILAVAADHSTPSVPIASIHSGEPVPVVFVGPRVRRDAVDTFDEIHAAKGCLGFLKGREMLLTLLNYADRAILLGHQLGGTVRPYFPKDYTPFKRTD